MIPFILMWLVTTIGIIYILYTAIMDKPIINFFFAVLFQSIFLFVVCYFWLHHQFIDAFIHSFDLLTIIVVAIYGIYKLNNDKVIGISVLLS